MDEKASYGNDENDSLTLFSRFIGKKLLVKTLQNIGFHSFTTKDNLHCSFLRLYDETLKTMRVPSFNKSDNPQTVFQKNQKKIKTTKSAQKKTLLLDKPLKTLT